MKRKDFNRKSQVWVSDYTISLLLFIMAALLCMKIVVNSFSADTDFEELKADASKISEMMLSEGYPHDWTNETVVRPGLLTAERLNESKVIEAMNMTYLYLKPKLKTKYEFLVIFQKPSNDMIEFDGLCVIGNPAVDINYTGIPPNIDCHYPEFTSISYNNLVKITRLVIYESEINRMVVYVWN